MFKSLIKIIQNTQDEVKNKPVLINGRTLEEHEIYKQQQAEQTKKRLEFLKQQRAEVLAEKQRKVDLEERKMKLMEQKAEADMIKAKADMIKAKADMIKAKAIAMKAETEMLKTVGGFDDEMA